jgi:hypothetical protein
MFFLADFIEYGAEYFPIDQRVEFRQEVVELVDFIELRFEIEEAELSFVFTHGR